MKQNQSQKGIRLFYSYSHADEEHRNELDKHLSLLKRQGIIVDWHDRRIAPGSEWFGLINDNLEASQIILLLVSSDFLASDYCYDIEVKRALERQEAGEARVIPIILRPVDWSISLFGKLQALPRDAKPVTTWANRDEAWLNVAKGIKLVCGELSTKKDISFEESPPDITFTSYDPATPLSTPYPEVEQEEMFSQKTLKFGPIALKEVAIILTPAFGPIWEPNRIAWKKWDRPFVVNPFWTSIDRIYPPKQEFEESDRIPGKHVRLATAGLMRHPEKFDLGLIWQTLSWEQSWMTNGRIGGKIRYQGLPIWSWFKEEDLITPPLESDKKRFDPPLGNRFAINLAVIVKSYSGEKEYAIFQKRLYNVAFSAEKYELGVSESIHGDRGWSTPKEMDVINGIPNLQRTALRCLWQELGIAEKGKTGIEIPTFEIEVYFTALILNKQELAPRLTGFAIVHGNLDELKLANQGSLDKNKSIDHVEFGPRRIGDAVPWERVRYTEATPSDLAWILQQWTSSPDCLLTPECRIRLVLYLNYRFGKHEAEQSFAHSFKSTPKPSWW